MNLLPDFKMFPDDLKRVFFERERELVLQLRQQYRMFRKLSRSFTVPEDKSSQNLNIKLSTTPFRKLRGLVFKILKVHSTPSTIVPYRFFYKLSPFRLVIDSVRSRDVRFLKDSSAFDYAWYLERYKDVAALQLDPVKHYIYFGAAEGRDPTPDFSTEWYTNFYADAQSPLTNPYVHYLKFGLKEGRYSNANTLPQKLDIKGRVVSTVSFPFAVSIGLAAPAMGLHVNVGTTDYLKDILEYLRDIPENITVFFSLSKELDSTAIESIIESELPASMQWHCKVTETITDGFLSFIENYGSFINQFEIIGHYSLSSSADENRIAVVQESFHQSFGSPLTLECIAGFLRASQDIGLLVADIQLLPSSTGNGLSSEALFQQFALQDEEVPALNPESEIHSLSSFWLKRELLQEFAGVFKNLSTDFNSTKLLQAFILVNGLDIVKYNVNVPYAGRYKYTSERPYPIEDKQSLENRIKEYQRNKRSNNSVVVYTAIAGNYDSLKVPEVLNPDIDYVCFCDAPQSGFGVFEIRAMDFYHTDTPKMSRFIKTHAHDYFPEYEISIWVDSNILLRTDFSSYIDTLRSQKSIFGAITHPLRSMLSEEVAECIKRAKDDELILLEQLECYSKYSDLPNSLIESNVFIAFHNEAILRKAMGRWWAELARYSRRDQVSFPVAFHDLQPGWTPILSPTRTARNHPDFALFDHGHNSGYKLPEDLNLKDLDSAPVSSFHAVRELRLKTVKDKTIDIVVCVHNALEDVRACLSSVYAHLVSGHRIIIVDDNSDFETQTYLQSFANTKPEVLLIRSDEPLRYTKAANTGLRASTADLVVLLNSDTIVCKDWALKLAEVAFATPWTGIVGPISNAASSQSVPSTRGSQSQTAINTIPVGLTLDDVDSFLEHCTVAGQYPGVQLVHGFCFAVRREVLETVGFLDEVNFPRGYGEENDFCLRTVDAGFSLRIATHTFVFHAKSKSYPNAERIDLMSSSIETMRQMHSATRIRSAIESIEQHPWLLELRAKVMSLYTGRSRPPGVEDSCDQTNTLF